MLQQKPLQFLRDATGEINIHELLLLTSIIHVLIISFQSVRKWLHGDEDVAKWTQYSRDLRQCSEEANAHTNGCIISLLSLDIMAKLLHKTSLCLRGISAFSNMDLLNGSKKL